MSIFELIMLFCFAAAWPASIKKSYLSKSNKGKSKSFLWVVWFGYIAGILHKIYFNFDWIILCYIFNCLMVSIDIVLYYRNEALCNNNN